MESQSLLSYLQRSLAMVMNEVTLTQAPTSNSLFAGDNDFAITLLVDSIERVLQHGRKTKFFGDPVLWDVCCEFGRRPWATILLGTANASGDSDESRGRIFLRYLIQNQLLVVFADELSQNEEILDEYFEPNAIMTRTDDYAIFRQQLVSLEALPLKFPGAPGPKVSYTPSLVQTTMVSQHSKQVEPQEGSSESSTTQPTSTTPSDPNHAPTAPAPVTSVNTAPAPLAVLASKKKKTVNRLISFDSGSNDSTTRKIKKPVAPANISSSSTVVDAEARETAQQDNLRESQVHTRPLDESSEIVAPNLRVDSPAPSNASSPATPSPSDPTSATIVEIVPKSNIEPGFQAQAVSVAVVVEPAPEPTVAPAETPPSVEIIPRTDSQKPENLVAVSGSETHSSPEEIKPTEPASDVNGGESPASKPIENVDSDNEDDEGKTLKLEVRHDDDHDSLDSASEDEGDTDVQNGTINSTVDTTVEQGDQSDDEVLTSIESADLSKLLAGFAASFSENQ